ncbi:MAG TPA: Ig-like domain repeat protein [Terriglobales bacterium]|nr:Ig-like domain repeat protein [Terriglobales bacterium]
MKLRLGFGTLLLVSTWCFAAQPDRIPGTINGGATVILAGNVAAQAQAQYDRGLVEASMAMPYIVLQTQPSGQQQAGLNKLLAQQQDRSSANYHKWLSPEQYAERFALSSNDIGKITSWLKSQGFGIVQIARGRDWIAFSGTAGLVETTFHTEIHYYEVGGEMHFANATPLSIPQALDGIVVGFRGMHDFSLTPMGIRPLSAWDRIFASIVNPFYNVSFGNALAPGDIATIYNMAPLYNAGVNGTGQKLVVVGQTDVHMTDISEFRSAFGLSNNNPQVVHVPGTADPGVTQDEVEADLDLEWSGAVARDAGIIFVVSPVSAGGVFNSASYAIDQDLAAVISMSYGGCESDNASFIPTNEPVMQKANAEGITFLASSGDSGSAGCDSDQNNVATLGLAVNYPASSPEVTGVGGNEFNEGTGNYWGNSNGTNGGSALSYIPEMAWNDSPQTGTGSSTTLSASGGGASSCHNSGCSSGFPKPTWQTGTGVPNDGVRDVPDVAMAASADHDGYLFCSADNGADCSKGINLLDETVGGTSASTPVFAGIVVLLNQQLGNKPPAGVGNLNPDLYTLAQNTANGIFHDVTSGSNIVPCTQGTKDCPAKAPFQYGYSAGTGYDQVTGLGSVDANNLATRFSTEPTTTTLTSSQNPASSGATVTFTATVTGSNSPTGTVTFYDGSTQIGTGTLSSGVTTFPTSTLSIGGHSITAAYGGDSKNSPSTSSPLIETITASGGMTTSTVVISGLNPSAYGSPVTFTATVMTTSGNPPGDTVTFQDGTAPLGFTTLTPNGVSSGTASFMISSLTAGTHSITGLYSGDSNNNASSTSPVIQQIVVKASTTTAAVPSPTFVNVKSTGPVQLSATLTPASGPTGSVNFSVDGTMVGSAKVGSNFSYNPSSLAAGSHSVTAAYQGDTNFNGSTSSAATLSAEDFQIAASPTTVNISAAGQSGTTTLTITPIGNFNQALTYSCSGLPSGATCGFNSAGTNKTTVTILTLASAQLRMEYSGRGAGIFYAMMLPGLLILPSGAFWRPRRKVLLLTSALTMLLLLMSGCGGGSGSGGGGGGTTNTVAITASTIGAAGTLSHSVNITLNVQ